METKAVLLYVLEKQDCTRSHEGRQTAAIPAQPAVPMHSSAVENIPSSDKHDP